MAHVRDVGVEQAALAMGGSRPGWIIAVGTCGTPRTREALINASDIASRTDVTAGPYRDRAQLPHEAAFARVCRPAAST
jgi:hypothetical protein